MTTDPSLTSRLPKGVARVVIAGGAVLAQADPDMAGQDMALRVGGDEVPFEPADAAAGDLGGRQAEYRPEFGGGPLVADADNRPLADLVDVSLNGIPAWALPGRPNLQMRFLDREAPCRLIVASPVRIPAHAGPLVFRAGLAAHRARGRLILRLMPGGKERSDTPIEKTILSFDPEKLGGTAAEDYAQVQYVLPPSEHATELHMTVAFDAYEGGEKQLAPFLFLADPHVGMPVETGPEEVADVFELTGQPAGPDAIWLRAPLPGLLGAGQGLDLLAGGEEYPLVTGSVAQVSLHEDHGHSLQLSASVPGSYRILINGQLALSRQLGPEPSWIRVPQQYQTGHYQNLAVMDASGTRRLLSTYVLVPRLLTPIDVLQAESRPPFPGPLMPQADHRYGALKAHMAAGAAPDRQAQIAHALSVLEGGHDNARLDPLTFPEVAEPDVSVVIPAHNGVRLTYLALASLLLAHNRVSFEVIVVDDGSDDETARLEEIVSGIRVVRNHPAQRFIRACNAGVGQARGTYVALLNNDVEVTNGWLDELVDAFGRFDNVGLVGSRLLYPDGRLQDAGGIIWSSGNPWNYGRGQNPWEPRFGYARQADYLCGAAMMTTRAIWEQVGGLSEYLEPMYFEDTDFAFKVREAGYTTWFVPSSVVYHYEGMTSGTDTGSGFKRYQEINRPKFKRRWAAQYARHATEGSNPDLEKDRGIVGRVLFIDYATPRPDRDAGSHAAIQEIRLVQSLGYKVTFLPGNMAHLGSYTEELQKMGVEVIHAPFFLSVEDYLTRHAADFDAFYITRFYVARDVVEPLRKLAPRARILFNNADLHFLRELRAGIAADDPEKIKAAGTTRDIELGVMRKVDVVLSYNEVEHSVIQSHTDGQVQVVKCPWVVDMPASVPGLEGRQGISFLGNYQHAPNAEGVLWFTRQVMPSVAAVHPGLGFHIYGSAMPGEIRALQSDVIHPEGFVETLSDAYDRHRIFIAPLLSGAGIKGKVLAALAHGVPCILTPIAAEGIGVRHGHDCLIASTPNEWRDAIGRLQGDDALWQSISEHARDYVRQSFSFDAGRDLMRAAFEHVDLYSPLA